MADPASLAQRADELAGDAGTLAHNLDALSQQLALSTHEAAHAGLMSWGASPANASLLYSVGAVLFCWTLLWLLWRLLWLLWRWRWLGLRLLLLLRRRLRLRLRLLLLLLYARSGLALAFTIRRGLLISRQCLVLTTP